jgi:hypothetical protein
MWLALQKRNAATVAVLNPGSTSSRTVKVRSSFADGVHG